MSDNIQSTESVKEGLIRVVSAERFQSKPRPGGNVQVVIMQKTGNTLQHYVTLRSPNDKLGLGEQIWGDFVAYLVDMSLRIVHIQDDFPTSDHVTKAHVGANIYYQVIDAELVTLGVNDALRTLCDEVSNILKREISRLKLEQVTEQYMQEIILKESKSFDTWLGIRCRHKRPSHYCVDRCKTGWKKYPAFERRAF